MTRSHVDRTSWLERAACRDWAPSVFLWDSGSRQPSDPSEYQKTVRAKAICGGCPVRTECLTYAVGAERAGRTTLGSAQFAWRTFDKSGNFTGYRYVDREFTASVTPAFGIWGGISANDRHRRDIKHLKLVQARQGKVCAKGVMCRGCRPTDEWVEMLLRKDAA